MSVGKRQFLLNLYAFLLLFFVSLYRQISLRLWPGDPVRTYILYGCYLFLCIAWAISIWLRVTQRTMRIFLLAEDAIILFAMTIRFVQDTFLYENVLLMRITGLWVSGTTLPALAMGFFATLGIGQRDDYRIPWRWFLILIPVVILCLLNLTDELHHFVCYIVPEEPQPNLIFHPGVGFVLIYLMGFVLLGWQIVIIYKKNRILSDRPVLRWLVPMFEPMLILLASFSFIMVSTGLIPQLEGVEVLEFYARIYYIEILSWEFYIYLGLVPVNTGYQEIFDHSTVSMKLLPAGSTVSPAPPGKEIHTYPLDDQIFIWEKDVSKIQQVISELSQRAESLQQESVLLSAELRTRNEEAATAAKNVIYNELTDLVKRQLDMMKKLSGPASGKDQRRRLQELLLLGTYVKRRCNLSLIQKEYGSVPEEDFRLSFQDMLSALSLIGVPTEFDWQTGLQLDCEEAIDAFEWFEEILEMEQYAFTKVSILAREGALILRLIGTDVDERILEGTAAAGPRLEGR